VVRDGGFISVFDGMEADGTKKRHTIIYLLQLSGRTTDHEQSKTQQVTDESVRPIRLSEIQIPSVI
jgi:hypothetical protein